MKRRRESKENQRRERGTYSKLTQQSRYPFGRRSRRAQPLFLSVGRSIGRSAFKSFLSHRLGRGRGKQNASTSRSGTNQNCLLVPACVVDRQTKITALFLSDLNTLDFSLPADLHNDAVHLHVISTWFLSLYISPVEKQMSHILYHHHWRMCSETFQAEKHQLMMITRLMKQEQPQD